MAQEATKDFFISYNKADRPWAEWMAWQLEAEGYTTVLQAWDFLPGSHFVLKMQEAANAATRTIAVLSPDYLDALYTQPEWAAAFVQDPTGQRGILLPVRVRECTLTGILAPIVYIDLLGLAEEAAREALLAGIRRIRARPSQAPGFPENARSATGAEPQTPGFPENWPSVWNVPYRRNPFFTGREALLSLLYDSLTRSGATALTQAQAISGLGGIGKTQTALEYAYRYGHLYHYVLWVGAATPAALLSDFVKLATLLEVPGRDEQDQHKTVEAVKAWLSSQRDWLLILDNADDLELAAEYLPVGNSTNGHVLLTTRAQNAGAVADLVDVEKMGKDEGALLLLRRARILAQTAALEQATPKDRARAEAIVAAMDGLPLALDQVGAYLQETGAPLSTYLGLYEKRRADLLARRGLLPPGHPDTVATTWSLSFQQVEQANPAAAELLRLCAFLAPDGIPEELLSKGAADLGDVLEPVAADEYLLNEAIEVLRRYSFVRRNPETKLLSMHRLVQAVLIDALKEKDQRLWAERAVRAVNSVFPGYDSWIEAERYLSQVPVCVALIERYRLAFPEGAYLLNRAGYSWYQRAEYEQAEPLYQRALLIYEQVEGPEHPSTANTLDLLARLYREQARYEQAEPLFQHALDIYEQVKGPEHPSTAVMLHGMAGLYLNQDKYEQAEPLFQRALRIREQVQGSEHPETATTLHELAGLYLNQARYEQAEPLLQRALHIYEQAKGPEHPYTATALHELARLYLEQARYEQAEPLLQRALRIHEQVLGPEHPYTATTLHVLAKLYLNQGKYEQAEPLLQRALRIKEKALGPEHPETAATLHELARLYLNQGKYEQAEPLFQRALHIKEKVLGPEHPNTAITVRSYAYLLRLMKRVREASLLEARIRVKEKKPGSSS